MTNITESLNSSEWTYIFIRGVKNPATYLYRDFIITYYKTTASSNVLNWYYEYPLTYYINNPPNFLSLDTVSVSDNDILYPSVYTFTFSGPLDTAITIPGKKVSIVIVIPTFYKSTLDANTAPVCKFAELSAASPCERFSSEISITETFTTSIKSLTLTITSLINPSLATSCDT